MPTSERTNQILAILRKKNRVSIDYLTSCLYVSKITVRRELKKMEELGLVTRSYGYVTLRDSENKLVPLVIRDQAASSIKDAIACKAAAMITNGSTIFMDGSSTVMRIVNYMHEGQDVVVITNSLHTATLLAEKKIPVYCTGGLVLPKALVCTGSFTEHMIRSVKADLMFFSSQGISQDGTISDFSETETFQRHLMLAHSKARYFLCDSSKLGKSFLFTVCNVREIDGIFCDVDTDEWFASHQEEQAEQ